MWTLAYGDHEDRTPTHGYEATREAAMNAFAKSCTPATTTHASGGRLNKAKPRFGSTMPACTAAV